MAKKHVLLPVVVIMEDCSAVIGEKSGASTFLDSWREKSAFLCTFAVGYCLSCCDGWAHSRLAKLWQDEFYVYDLDSRDNMIKKPNTVILSVTFLLAVAVVMYVFNLFTPLFCDDWHYVFIFGTRTPIQSIGDIFVSQWAHYFEFAGRFVVHWFVQLFDGLLGKGVFNVFNALGFSLFLYVIAVLSTSVRSLRYRVMSVAFLLVFLLMPGFKYTFLWLSGSFNYMWSAIVVMLFMHVMEKPRAVSPWMYAPLFLFGLFSGQTNEAFVMGLGAAYFIYYAFHRKELSPWRVSLLLGFFVGAALLVFSPAAIRRAITSNAGGLSMVDRLINMQNLRIFFLLILWVVYRLFAGRSALVEWIKQQQVLIIATVVTFVFLLLTGVNFSHSRFGLELFSLLLLLRGIDWNRIGDVVATVSNVAVLAFACYVLPISHRCYAVNQEELSHVDRPYSQIVTTNPIDVNSFVRRYILDYAGFAVYDGINDEKYYGVDDWIANYYGFEEVQMLPKVFLDDLAANHDAYDEIRTLDTMPFYAIRLKPGQDMWYAQMFYEPSRFSDWPWPLNRLCAKLTGEIDYDISDAKEMTVNGERFAMIRKIHPTQDYRLKEIKLVEHDHSSTDKP